MRVLRLLVLLAILLIVYCAQYLFDHGTLAGLYPAWATQRFPALVRTTLWQPQDLHTLALWLLGGSTIVFGLLVPAWPEAPRGGIHLAEVSTSARWGLLALLAGTALLVAWGWTNLPASIDGETAAFGLQAQALLRGGGDWLAPGVTGAAQVASLPVGLLMLALNSAPAASHLLGLLAALGTIMGTYLLAVELFVVSARRHQLGLLAAGFTGCTLALLHFGRLAAYLPATAAGVLAAWLLLAGYRSQKPAWLAASGLLVAAACWLDRTGLVFVLLLLLWWPSLRFDEARRGRLHFATWAVCALLVLAPLLLSWLLNAQAFGAYLYEGQGSFVTDWWSNLRLTATTFFWTADASPVIGPAGHLVASVVAPLFVFAWGGLLMSLDRPLGWRLLTWVSVVLLFSSAINPVAPYWPTLLPLLPLTGLAITYTFDRISALWSAEGQEPRGETEGTKGDEDANSPFFSLTVGLLIAVAALTAVSYYQYAANGDPPSYTGRALAALAPGAVALLVSSDAEQAVRLDDPIVQYIAGERANQALAVPVNALPASLPPGSLLIVQGADRMALSAAQTQYPGAAVQVIRDLRANPRLYLLRVP